MWRSGAVNFPKEGLMFRTNKGAVGHLWSLTIFFRKLKEKFVQKRRVIIRELHHIIPEVSKTTIHEAVIEKLGYRKLCARWVPKMLTDDHKTKGMDSALKFLTRYAQEGWWFSELHCDWRWNMGFSPHSWIQASVNAMVPYTFPQNQKFKTSNSVKFHGFRFVGQKRHSPGRLHASWLSN